MEAEQSSFHREYPVTFGQKWEIVGVGQSDTANNTLCRYCFQVHPFLAKNAPGIPVFGHCPLSNYHLLYPVECADLIVVFESHATVGQLFHPLETSCVSKEDEWGTSLKMLHMRGAMRH